MIRIPVTLPVAVPDSRAYAVHVGSGVRHHLAEVLAAACPRARRAAIVTQAGIAEIIDGAGGLEPGVELLCRSDGASDRRAEGAGAGVDAALVCWI